MRNTDNVPLFLILKHYRKRLSCSLLEVALVNSISLITFIPIKKTKRQLFKGNNVYLKSPFDPTKWLSISDGWTKNDLVYEWYPSQPVQIPRNLTLPGGFKLGKTGNDSCDVTTATGPLSLFSLNIYICKEQSSNYPDTLCPFLGQNFWAEFLRKVFLVL